MTVPPTLLLVIAIAGCKKVDDRPRVEMPPVADVAPLARASNTLAFELWARARTTPGNLVISPASIAAALAMTAVGAVGETRAQIGRVLHLDGPAGSSADAWGTLSLALEGQAGVTLRIANRLFGQTGYPFEASFLDRTRRTFGAPLEPVDFRGSPDGARDHINDWVADRTTQRIKGLLPPHSIDGDTRLVLVNAIYFLGEWATRFDPEATSAQPFALSATATTPVPTMHAMASFRVARLDGMTMLELPYRGEATAMLVILPDRVDGLADLEQSLDAGRLECWTAALAMAEVSVSLPRFVVDPPAPIELGEDLKALGMPLAFDPGTADFTAIATPPEPSRRLYIGAVVHKAFVEVDERGTTAAAATAVSVPAGVGARRPDEVKADHPFLFAIVERATGMVLFLGRVVDPR